MNVKITYKAHHLTSIFPKCSGSGEGGCRLTPLKALRAFGARGLILIILNLGVMLLSNPGENTAVYIYEIHRDKKKMKALPQRLDAGFHRHYNLQQ